MSNWKEYKLGDISDYINRGVTPLYSEDGVIVINQKCVRDGQVKYEQSRYTNSEKKKITEEKYLKSFDILINSTGQGTLGRVGQVKEITTPTTVDSHLTIVRIKNNINPVFMGYVLKSKQSLIEDLAEGTTGQTELSRHKVAGIPILLPDLPTQTSIAEILSSLDDKIELNNKINYELETLAQTLFKQWFIDFEFPNENGEPYKSSGGEMVDSEFGEIPKEWEIGKIGDYIKFIKGKKPLEVFDTESENTLPQILIETLDTGKSMFAKPEKMTICEKEDLIMVLDGASSGRIEIGFRGILGSTLAIIKSNGINNNLLYQFLKFKEQDIRNNTTGAAIPHTDKSKIFEYTISLPTENIASNFSSIQENISNMIFSNKSELKSLTHLRDTLLPKLISGELEINEINN
jgi:type I restriction enzyme S subunit